MFTFRCWVFIWWYFNHRVWKGKDPTPSLYLLITPLPLYVKNAPPPPLSENHFTPDVIGENKWILWGKMWFIYINISCIYLSYHPSIYLVSIYLSIHPYILYLSVYLSIHISCIYLSIYLSIHIFCIYLSIYPSIYLVSIYLSIHPYILYLSIYPSIYLVSICPCCRWAVTSRRSTRSRTWVSLWLRSGQQRMIWTQPWMYRTSSCQDWR